MVHDKVSREGAGFGIRAPFQAGRACRGLVLPFHLFQLVDRDILEGSVDVDHDGDGDGAFGSSNGDGEEREDIAVMTFWIEHAIEHREVEVGRVQHQFDGEQNGQGAAAREKTEDACKHHYG